MNKIRLYFYLLYTISSIAILVGILLPTPVRGNLSDLYLVLYSAGLIGAIVGIILLYYFVFIPLKILYFIYASGGFNSEMRSRAVLKSKFEVWFERAWVLVAIIIFFTNDSYNESLPVITKQMIEDAGFPSVRDVVGSGCEEEYLTKEDIELCKDERFKELKETIERNKTPNKK